MVLETEAFTIPFGRNRYCGPAALAYVMRSDPDTAARLLRDVSGKRKIVGTSYTWMLKALSQVGLQAENTMPVVTAATSGKRLTLRKWLEWSEFSLLDSQFIVTVTAHYLVIHNGRYFDNGCHLGKPLARCPYLNKTVKRAWEITGTAQIPAPPASVAALRKDIERRYGVRIVVDGGECCELFPVQEYHSFEGTHSLVCGDLADVQARVSLPIPCPEDCDCREELQ
jgi:hypothetical protein